jgi:hypothetical protein
VGGVVLPGIYLLCAVSSRARAYTCARFSNRHSACPGTVECCMVYTNNNRCISAVAHMLASRTGVDEMTSPQLPAIQPAVQALQGGSSMHRVILYPPVAYRYSQRRQYQRPPVPTPARHMMVTSRYKLVVCLHLGACSMTGGVQSQCCCNKRALYGPSGRESQRPWPAMLQTRPCSRRLSAVPLQQLDHNLPTDNCRVDSLMSPLPLSPARS